MLTRLLAPVERAYPIPTASNLCLQVAVDQINMNMIGNLAIEAARYRCSGKRSVLAWHGGWL